MKAINLKEKLLSLAPLIGMVLVIAVFAIMTGGKTLSNANLKIVMNQAIITAIVAIGGVFIYSCKAIDMSLSGSICLAAICGALAANKTGSVVIMILTIFVVAMAISLCKGVAAAYLTLPVFIVTIIFGNFLSAIGLVLMGTETTLKMGEVITFKTETSFYVAVLVLFYLICLVLFNYTSIGKANKLVGGNPVAAEQSGISSKRSIITAFLISGIGVALATLITILRTKTVTSSTGSGIGQDVLIAVVLGGMPLSGGSRSRISAAIIGSMTITFLNNGLSIIGVSNDHIQIVRGIVFLAVVSVTSLSYRTKLLQR